MFKTNLSIYLFIIAGNWEKAHNLLKNNPTLSGLNEELETYGKKLENTGQIKEAEKLYLALDKADLAINMYKNFQRYDEVCVSTSRQFSNLTTELKRIAKIR